MKNILIIYPHWYPCNLAGVHRPRLLANFLPEFGWQPLVLTIDEKYYEETPDPDFYRTFSDQVIVHRVKAIKVKRKWFPVGDIGLRGFFQLYQGAMKIIDSQKIDFILIPIPSFYTAVLGRLLFLMRGIKYGIDYIDPWIRDISTRKNIKSRLSQLVANLLEPFSVKKASLISGVSTAYYLPVLERNFKNKPVIHLGIPYGFDPKDHTIKLDHIEYPWKNIPDCKPLIYAGAFLPKSHLFIDLLFKSVRSLVDKKNFDKNIRLFFTGTGFTKEKTISDYAKDYRIEEYIFEIKERFPYLHVLNFLSEAYGIMVIGSTEKHYTASKVFQALLSKRPLYAILHEESTACGILQSTNADKFLVKYSENIIIAELQKKMEGILLEFISPQVDWAPDLSVMDSYSARNCARLLSEKINLAVL